jgi:hypothetical protein
MHQQVNSRPAVDSAQLLRLRRLAKRSRAEAACQLCKASKLRCSDYRPCARCKKVGANSCMDLTASATSVPHAIRGTSSSNRSCTLTSRIADCSSRDSSGDVSALKVRTTKHHAELDDSLRWRFASSSPSIPSIPRLYPTSPPPSASLEPMLAETVDPADAIPAWGLRNEQVR